MSKLINGFEIDTENQYNFRLLLPMTDNEYLESVYK